MTHSQQPTDILDVLIKEQENQEESHDTKTRIEILSIAKRLIGELPQSPSVESLLEENVGYSEYVTFSNMTTYWVAQTRKETAYGDSPILALLALKQKLNNNNQ